MIARIGIMALAALTFAGCAGTGTQETSAGTNGNDPASATISAEPAAPTAMVEPTMAVGQPAATEPSAAELTVDQLPGEKVSGNIQTTPSGLRYIVITEGSGDKPTATSTVKVHYSGYLANGTKFDSSVDRGQPLQFPLNQVIPGWTEGLQLMSPGAKYKLIIPAELGYGAAGAPGAVPPNATLVFDVELIDFQ